MNEKASVSKELNAKHKKTKYVNEQPKQKAPTPGLVYLHIPLPEFSSFTTSNFTGVKKEGISSPSINSGFFASMVEAGDVKAAFIGHDHINDFCGKLSGIQLCYAGGFGYHAYGKAGWSRRARVVSVQFEKTVSGEWRGVKSIKTWKRLDDQHFTTIDSEVLWNKGSNGRRRKNPDEAEFRMGTMNAASYLYTSCVLPVYLTKFVIV